MKKNQTNENKDIIKEFKKSLVREIVCACIERATESTDIRILKEIKFGEGYIEVTLENYEYLGDVTTIKKKKRAFVDLGSLIVEKENFIDFIKENFVNSRGD